MNTTSQKLATQIWAIANDLRGSMDASKFKDYILGIIFYRYLSTHTESYMNDLLKNDGITYREALADPEYADTVREWALDKLGYVIEPEYMFDSLVEKIKAGDNTTDETKKFSIEDLEKAISKLTESTIGQKSEAAFANLFDAMNLRDADLGKEVSERTQLISTIILRISDTPFAKDSEGGDVLGTAYMILIGLFQSNAGKKGGEFFTPTPVSTLLAQLTTIGIGEVKNACDGCAGSGSLLLEVQRHLPSRRVHHYYGQEKTGTTYNLLRMNLIMHGVDYSDFTVYNDDTLIHDNFYENGEPVKFDIQVENPPYSAKNSAFASKYLEDPRYKSAGVLAPKTKADLAFVESMVYHMADDGRVAVLLPHGVLFRGGQEQEIRKYLIDKINVIDAVIGLAPNMFHGTGIPVCVMLLKKKRNGNSGNILFIDASKCFTKEGKNNALRDSDIKRIVDCVKNRADIEKFSRKVSLEEIRANDYNMNIPRYVDSSEESEKWDIYSLVFGGVPESEIKRFDRYFDEFDGLKDALFEKHGESYKVRGDIKDIFYANDAVKNYIATYKKIIEDMHSFLKETLIDNLESLDLQDTNEAITDELFKKIETTPFIDKYDAYQLLADEWKDISSDIDVIQHSGFNAVNEINVDKDGEVSSILPFELVQETFLSDTLNELNEKKNALSSAEDGLNEVVENLTDEDKEYDADGEAIYDTDKNAVVNKAITKAAKAISKEYKKSELDDDSVEKKIIQINDYNSEIKGLKADVKVLEKSLDTETRKTIQSLSKEDALVLLEDKWIEPFINSISGMAETIVNDCVSKMNSLVKRYAVTMEEEDKEIDALEKSLAEMLGQIKGNDADDIGSAEIMKFLGGA